MNDIAILDVGGTFVKYARFTGGKPAPGFSGQFPINEKGAAAEILGAIEAHFHNNPPPARACVSIPGPMHYPTGASRMKHKFAALEGISMKEYFEARFPGTNFSFVHDGIAYMAGVFYLGETEGAKTPAGIMLGTGLGFCFMEGGEILENAVNTPCFPLYNEAFEGGAAEDYVSGRAIRSMYAREGVDVKEIALRARAGDAQAIDAFARCGRALGRLIEARAARLNIDRVILGGQISKSADLLLPFAEKETHVPIAVTKHPDDAALYGAYAVCAGLSPVRPCVEIGIPFGRGKDVLHLPASRVKAVLAPLAPEESADAPTDIAAQCARVENALQNPIGSAPLRALARGKKRVLLITSDHTRPVPSAITVPRMLREIRAGSPEAEIVILVATGMHRPSTKEEIEQKLGRDIAESETIEVHDSRDAARMANLGTLPSGGKLILNARVEWADLVVSDGFIEPHFFAGFSGGRKSILPGIASEQTVRYNHNAQFIETPRAGLGEFAENPIHRDMIFAAKAAGLAFILNVLIDADKRIVAAVAGDPEKAHAAGCEMCLARTRVPRAEAEIAVSSNGGYPLDQNLYQAVKGMTAAEACVTPGGAIVMAAACDDGHGGEHFFQMISGAKTPRAFLDEAARVNKDETPADQWEAQILARILDKAKVYFVTSEKNRALVEKMHMTYAPNCDFAVRAALREHPGAQVTVVPDGVGVIVR